MTPQQVKDLKDLFSKRYGRLLVLVIIGVIIAVGVLIGHRLQQDRQVSQKVDAWHNKYSYIITGLTKDFASAQTDSKANNFTGLASDCTQVHKDAVSAEQAPKIPDSSAQQYWAAALDDDAVGSMLCNEGINQGSTADMEEANTDFNKSTTNLETVSKDLQKAHQQK